MGKGKKPAKRQRPAAKTKKKAAKAKFERGLLSRGEVVPKGAPLSPRATHEVVGTEADGRPILKRRRFSFR